MDSKQEWCMPLTDWLLKILPYEDFNAFFSPLDHWMDVENKKSNIAHPTPALDMDK